MIVVSWFLYQPVFLFQVIDQLAATTFVIASLAFGDIDMHKIVFGVNYSFTYSLIVHVNV